MNNVILTGRLTRDPDVRYSQGDRPMAVARFTLAVDRSYKKDGEKIADFIRCVTFGKTAEFIEKYFRQGTKINLRGWIRTGSYTNRDGQKVYTTEVIAELVEPLDAWGQSKEQKQEKTQKAKKAAAPEPAPDDDGFCNIPDDLDDYLPF